MRGEVIEEWNREEEVTMAMSGRRLPAAATAAAVC